jgi:type II secretory pathway pseudopilin PulG
MRRRRGWVLLDMITAMLMLSATAGILATGEYAENNALRRLSDLRAATRAAEAVMTQLQRGSPAAFMTPPDMAIHMRVLPQSASSPQMDWVEVAATISKETATLTGMVPSSAVGGTAHGGGQ